MQRTILMLLCFMVSSTTAISQTFTAFQGDVLRLEVPQQAGTVLKVQAFGQTWPIYQHQGKHIAWIGIHLKTKPQTYPLHWTTSQQVWQDEIKVNKGKFRISHIQVKKSMSTFDKASLKRIRADQKAIRHAYQTPVSIHHDWPEMIQPTQGIISTPFAAQRYVNGKAKSPHSGLDIAAPSGTPVIAPLAGKVLLVSDMFLNGTLVAIGHGDGFTTVYAHLQRALVKEGQMLEQGDLFAEVGSTGRSTGPHLHWGVHFAGAKINPQSMLSQHE